MKTVFSHLVGNVFRFLERSNGIIDNRKHSGNFTHNLLFIIVRVFYFFFFLLLFLPYICSPTNSAPSALRSSSSSTSSTSSRHPPFDAHEYDREALICYQRYPSCTAHRALRVGLLSSTLKVSLLLPPCVFSGPFVG